MYKFSQKYFAYLHFHSNFKSGRLEILASILVDGKLLFQNRWSTMKLPTFGHPEKCRAPGNTEFFILANLILQRIWASSWDYGTYNTGDQRRLKRAWAFSPEPSLFAHMKYGSRWRVWPDIRHLALLDGCICTFVGWVYGGRKVPYLMRWLICVMCLWFNRCPLDFLE